MTMGGSKSAGVTRRVFVGGVATCFATTGSFAQGVSAAPPVIRFATGGGIGPSEIETVVFLDWMKANVLKRHGKEYVVNFTFTRSAAEAAQLMAAEQADLGAFGFINLLTAVRRDAVAGGVTVIADIFQDGRRGWASNTFFVSEDSEIKTPKDLKGKVIGVVAFGTPLDMALRVVLKKAGLDPKTDVQVVEIAFPNIGPALREKRIDCGSLVHPFMAMETAKGGIRSLFNYGDAYGNFSVLFQVARTKFLQSNKAAVKAYLDDYVHGLKWLYAPENREKAIEITAQLVKSTPQALSYFLTNGDYYRDQSGCISAPLIQSPIDAITSAGLNSGAFDAKPYIDTSFLPTPC